MVLSRLESAFIKQNGRAARIDELDFHSDTPYHRFDITANGLRYSIRAHPLDPKQKSFFTDETLEIRESSDPDHPAGATSPIFATKRLK